MRASLAESGIEIKGEEPARQGDCPKPAASIPRSPIPDPTSPSAETGETQAECPSGAMLLQSRYKMSLLQEYSAGSKPPMEAGQ